MSNAPFPITVANPQKFTVFAKPTWNRSQILVEAGQTYRLEILQVTQWQDAWIQNIDPTQGYRLWYLAPLAGLRRFPQANWFALIGAIGKDRNTFFPIDQTPMKYIPTTTGEFLCFANDAPFAYGNNSGQLTLQITRL